MPFTNIYEYNSPVVKFRLLKNVKTNMVYPQYQTYNSIPYWKEINTELICVPTDNGKYIGDELICEMYAEIIDEIVLVIISKHTKLLKKNK